jgi:hypothetical protein
MSSKQIQIRKPVRRTTHIVPDTRTPKGQVLPY